jgi:erythromycin esterase-like protein
VVEYLRRADPAAAERARKRYGCFGDYRDRPDRYGSDVAADAKRSCEAPAAAQLKEMAQRLAMWRAGANPERDDDLFSAYQNARVVKNGEAYYRQMYEGKFSTWNLRDSHMAETLHELTRYLDAFRGPKAKVVVWAHNTHQGDARMTEMGEAGELNVGHIMRQSRDGDTVLVGFTTYTGEVTAATEWGSDGQTMKVRPALPESYSALFHATGAPNFLLILRGGGEQLARSLGEPRPRRSARAIISRPACRDSSTP